MVCERGADGKPDAARARQPHCGDLGCLAQSNVREAD